MTRARRKPPARRQPRQERARATVTAVLDAAVRILRREGLPAVTTNRIAEVAGVSIGSVYQYFPDKAAIFGALHDRHVDEISAVVEATLLAWSPAPLDELLRALIVALVDAHAADPELHVLLMAEVPHRGHGAHDFARRLRNSLKLALAGRWNELGRRRRDPERALFVLTHQISALAHAAALERPPRVSLTAAKDEAVQAVLAYLRD